MSEWVGGCVRVVGFFLWVGCVLNQNIFFVVWHFSTLLIYHFEWKSNGAFCCVLPFRFCTSMMVRACVRAGVRSLARFCKKMRYWKPHEIISASRVSIKPELNETHSFFSSSAFCVRSFKSQLNLSVWMKIWKRLSEEFQMNGIFILNRENFAFEWRSLAI